MLGLGVGVVGSAVVILAMPCAAVVDFASAVHAPARITIMVGARLQEFVATYAAKSRGTNLQLESLRSNGNLVDRCGQVFRSTRERDREPGIRNRA